MPWIRPQDRMPEKGEVVLITDKEGMQIVAWIDMYNGEWHSENHRWWPREVVYWMPIPQPPKPLPMPWINPQDQMPEENDLVLITDKEGLQIVAWYVAAIDMWYSDNHSWFTSEVNYWMPIPQTPKP